ncbi:MAG: hypothetical protein IKY23_10360 [Lachnospiraceae bacterium]|nr:hypothetical protein [Lachnospiraceae bacterium]
MNLSEKEFAYLEYVGEKARKTLDKVCALANDTNDKRREAVPSLLVTAESFAECSRYGKAYGRILEQSPLVSIRGSRTYLELVFPKNHPQDEQKFFSSPQRAVGIRNRFYGTMLISLEEYTGTDLMKSDSLLQLLGFIEANKKNIRFVFYISPGFGAKGQLLARLRKYIPMVEVTLSQPDVDMGYQYVSNELTELGFILEESVREQIKAILLPTWMARNDFEGYNSLDTLVSRINCEAMMLPESENMIISTGIIEDFLVRSEKEQHEMTEVSRLGFHS